MNEKNVVELKLKTSANPKTAARLCAVQACYSLLIDVEQEKETALNAAFEIMQRDNIKVKRKFSESLLDFYLAEREALEQIITKYLEKDKTIDKVNPLLLAILSIALAELSADKETPRAILMSEYLFIASEFFNGAETGFINAVLDKFIKDDDL